MGDGLRYIDVAERRARLGLRHRLAGAARAAEPTEVAESLVALHGTDPAAVYLAVGARLTEPAKTVARTERALYEDRALVRMHGMRHTVFVFPTDLTAVVHASTGLAVAARERASLVKDMAKAGAPDAAWLAEVEESALAALARRGQATATELAEDEPRLREQFVYAAGKSYEGVHTSRRGCCGCSASKERWCGGDRWAPGRPRSSGGHRHPSIPNWTWPRHRRSCCGAGSRRADRRPRPT